MKLHYASASPYVRKVLVTALELGLGGRIEKVDTVPVPTDTNQALAADNPLAKIPTLITDDGEALYDSRTITAYLNEMAVAEGKPGVVPAGGTARWRVLRQEALCDGILDGALLTRYEQVLRPEDKRWRDWTDAQFGRVVRSLDHLDATLGDWTGGESADTGADMPADLGAIATGCVLGYLDFRFGDADWRGGRDGLAAWYDAFSQRPSMAETAPQG